jgi:hypothetical protein
MVRFTSDPRERVRAILADHKLEEEFRSFMDLPDEEIKTRR